MQFASADVKVTAKVTVTGAASKSGTKEITTFYKGSLVRTEGPETVSIYDSKTETLISYRKGENTYRQLKLDDGMRSIPGMLAKIKINSSADIKEMPDKATIAGKTAKKYVGTATIQIVPESLPQGGPKTRIDIEQWMTEDVKIDNADSPLGQMVEGMKAYGGVEPVLQAMSKMKGLPLTSKVTVTVEGGKQATGPIVTLTEVKSVEEGPLSDELFRVPEGFKLVQPRRPSFPSSGAHKQP